MKKSVAIAVLGLAVGAVSSFGQGSIVFNSYAAASSGATVTTFGPGNGAATGTKVGSGTSAGLYVADILYSLSPITDVAGNGALTAGWLTSGSGAPSVNNLITQYGTGVNAGYFVPANNFVLTPYTAGTTVYFEVITYLASAGSYGASVADRGHSASFNDTLATGLVLPVNASWSSFTVTPVPEPTTLALGALGGLSLLLFRRKQS